MPDRWSGGRFRREKEGWREEWSLFVLISLFFFSALCAIISPLSKLALTPKLICWCLLPGEERKKERKYKCLLPFAVKICFSFDFCSSRSESVARPVPGAAASVGGAGLRVCGRVRRRREEERSNQANA